MRIAVRGEGGVADEGRVVDAAKFHLWSKCATPLTQIGCQMLPLACELYCIVLRGSFISHLGV